MTTKEWAVLVDAVIQAAQEYERGRTRAEPGIPGRQPDLPGRLIERLDRDRRQLLEVAAAGEREVLALRGRIAQLELRAHRAEDQLSKLETGLERALFSLQVGLNERTAIRILVAQVDSGTLALGVLSSLAQHALRMCADLDVIASLRAQAVQP